MFFLYIMYGIVVVSALGGSTVDRCCNRALCCHSYHSVPELPISLQPFHHPSPTLSHVPAKCLLAVPIVTTLFDTSFVFVGFLITCYEFNWTFCSWFILLVLEHWMVWSYYVFCLIVAKYLNKRNFLRINVLWKYKFI